MAITLAVSKKFNYIRGRGRVTKTPAGWIGSKAGAKNDLVTIDANGYIDQAVAAGSNVAAGTKLAILANPIASTVAAASADALREQVIIPTQRMTITLMNVTSAGAAKATTAAMVGKSYEIKRLANGNYAVDTDTTTNTKVIVDAIDPSYPVGTIGGGLVCRFIEAQVAL